MWQTFVWLGQAGTLTPCHQDYYHNFYVMMEGTKHFLLLPPSVHRLLYLHPSLHPAHRSSQVFVQKCPDGAFPLARDLPAMQATLKRGANSARIKQPLVRRGPLYPCTVVSSRQYHTLRDGGECVEPLQQ